MIVVFLFVVHKLFLGNICCCGAQLVFEQSLTANFRVADGFRQSRSAPVIVCVSRSWFAKATYIVALRTLVGVPMGIEVVLVDSETPCCGGSRS